MDGLNFKLKKDFTSEDVIRMWKWIALTAFFFGLYIGAKYYEREAHNYINEYIEDAEARNPQCFLKYTPLQDLVIESQNLSTLVINISKDSNT